MKKIYLTLIAMLALCSTSYSVVVQHVYLKNGSVLNGYIQKQDGMNNLTFKTDNATINLNSKDVVDINNEKAYNIKELDKSWIDWAEENKAFEGIGDNRTLTLCDIVLKDRVLTKVRVLERGIIVKYIEMAPNTYVLSWKDIQAIKGDKRPKTALSGINRIYMLTTGVEYEGEYAEETDSTLSLFMNDNVVRTFNSKDVIKYVFRPINPNQDIFAQSELLDVIYTVNKAIIKGIIIEENYSSKKDSDNYFLIQQQSGAIQSIKVSDIVETSHEDNDKYYAPQYDILLHIGDVVVNRMNVAYINVKENNDILTLDSITYKVTIPKNDNGTDITVEYRKDNDANVEAFQLVKVTKSIVKKKTVYSFSYKDLLYAKYNPKSISTSINHTTKAQYTVSGQGVFALFDAKSKRAIPIIVK